jgi:hypothetical protein
LYQLKLFENIVYESCSLYSFEIRPSRSFQDPVDPGLKLDRVEKKIGEEKTWLTRQGQVKNPVVNR